MYAKQKPVEYSPGVVLELFNVGGNKTTYILKTNLKVLVEEYVWMNFCYHQGLKG